MFKLFFIVKNIYGDNVKSKHKKGFKIFILIIFFVFLLYFGLYYVYMNFIVVYPNSEYNTQALDSNFYSQSVEEVIEKSVSVSDMIEKVSESVVGISKLKNTSNSIFSNNFDSELGIGTGIIVSSNGYILSNSHVTGEKYSSCYITLSNGNTYDGKVVWSDTNLDLSICKINADSLTPVTFGDSSSVKAGEFVFAIGNPIGFEFQRTVTSGIISAINRTIKLEENDTVSYMTDLIQTDATINPGNSGGPLLLSNGNVIGINTVKITSAEGIGFAVPINVIKPVIDSFIKVGGFDEASLGILAYDSNVIPYLTTSSKNFTSGIYVAQISTTGPAASSTLREGDIINSIDGFSLTTMNDLRAYIYTKKPNDTVVLNISRGKITKDISITLSKK